MQIEIKRMRAEFSQLSVLLENVRQRVNWKAFLELY